MKYTILIACVLVLTSCTAKKNEEKCAELTKQMSTASEGYLIGCVKSCFRSTSTFAKNPADTEQFKDACSSTCRDNIPYAQLNAFKQDFNSVYNCKLPLEQGLANVAPSKEIKK
jgi:hypothetical protein